MKFEQLMDIISTEVSSVLGAKDHLAKDHLREPEVKKPKKQPYRVALNTEDEINEFIFVQDDLKKLEDDKKKKKNNPVRL